MIGRRAALIGLGLLPAARLHAAELPAPAVSVQHFTDGLLRVMKAGRKMPFPDRVQMLTPIVEQVFDLPLILRRSVGSQWSKFSDAAKADLFAAFEAFTVTTWVANFDNFDGEVFEIAAEVRPVGQEMVVQTRIVPKSGDPTRLDYVMREVGRETAGAPGVWRAVDILLNGTISRVAVQRSDFRAIVDAGDPGALIIVLRNKTAALAAGAAKP